MKSQVSQKSLDRIKSLTVDSLESLEYFGSYQWPCSFCLYVQANLGAAVCFLFFIIIAAGKTLFFNQKVLIFFLFLHENMLWVLIRSPLPWHSSSSLGKLTGRKIDNYSKELRCPNIECK